MTVGGRRAIAAYAGGRARVAFGSNRGDVGHFGLYVADVVDGTARRLRQGADGAWWCPAWSPDGTRLAVVHEDAGGRDSLRLLNADGSGESAILTAAAGQYLDAPAWSPDSTTLVFSRFLPCGTDPSLAWNEELWTIGVDGTGLRQLTAHACAATSTYARNPAWSPDGATIAFCRDVGGNGTDFAVWFVDADGRNPRRGVGVASDQPVWSPDGSRLAYLEYRSDGAYLMRANADGSSPVVLVSGAIDAPVWTADGASLVYSLQRPAGSGSAVRAELWTVPAAGGAPSALTTGDGTSEDVDPSWQAVPPRTWLTPTLTYGVAPLTVGFSAATAAGATPLLDFGDATSTVASSASHTYAAAGVYEARYTLTQGAAAAMAMARVVVSGGGAAGGLVTVTPRRLLDTRSGLPGPLGDGDRIDVTVAGGATGVPADAAAVVLNVTVVSPSAGGFVTTDGAVTVWPTGLDRPTASNLNFRVGRVALPNAVVSAVGSSGQVSVGVSGPRTHVLVDVFGYFGRDAAFSPMWPWRLLDTRPTEAPYGGRKTRIGAGETVNVTVAGADTGVAAGAQAVWVNVTAVGGSATSYLTVWPTGAPRPDASHLNWTQASGVVPNLVLVGVGGGGQVSLFNNAGTAELIVDVVGQVPAASPLRAITPTRLFDTRPGYSAIENRGRRLGESETWDVVVAGGISPVPATASGVVMNVTAVGPSAFSYLTVWPAATSRPDVSNLNYAATDQAVPNLVVAGIGAGRAVSVFNRSGSTDLIFDLVGWF